MQLLGRATSGNVQKVLFLLEELGIEYSREDYGRQFGNTATAEYLALNPTGKVPTLVDGEEVIWESNSILRYLARKTKSPLYPSDLGGRTQVERWMDWLLASLNGPYLAIFKASKAKQEAPAAAVKEMVEALSLVDRHLAGNRYLAGETMTLADICLGPIVHRCLGFPVDLPTLPKLRAWHADLSARPAFQKVVKA